MADFKRSKAGNIIVGILLLICIPTLSAQFISSKDSLLVLQLDEMLGSDQIDSVKFKFALNQVEKFDLEKSGLAFSCLKKFIDLAEQKKAYRWEGDLYSKLGNIYYYINQNINAEAAFENALLSYKKTGEDSLIVEAHNCLSSHYACTDRSDKAQENAYAAIAICERTGDEEGLAEANQNIALNFINFGEPERGLPFAKKVLDYYEKTKNISGALRAIVLLSYTYQQLGEFEKALVYINNAVEIGKEEGMMQSVVSDEYYLDRADIYSNLQNFPKAKEDLEYLRDFAPTDRTPLAKYRLEINLALNAFQRADYNLSKQLFLKNINDPNASKNIYLVANYGALCKVYIKQNRYDSAYHYHMLTHDFEKEKKFHESRLNREALMAKYESGKKEATIVAQKEIISQHRIIQWFIGGVLALLGLLLLQTVRNSKARRRSNEKLQKTIIKLEETNKENEVLLKEIHHRVKNNLQTVSSLLSLQSDSITDPEVLKAIEDSKNRVASIALIHQKLYMGQNLAFVEMSEYFRAIGQTIIESFGPMAARISFEVNMSRLELNVDTAVPIGLITNELITNSVKYAFINVEDAKITVSMEKGSEDMIHLKIGDNGIYIDAGSNPNKGTGFGSMLVQLLTKQLNGELETTITDGTVTYIKFKLKDENA